MAYVRTRLGRWYYQERGSARRADDPAIVLLHGLLFDGGMWSKQVEPLSALGRVVVIDGPAHGKSEPPPPFTLEDHADALISDALRELKIHRAILIGLSWGGMVSMRAAVKHPERVAALVLMDTSASREDRKRAVKYRAFVSFARRFGLPQWLVDRDIAPVMFAPESLRARPELATELARRVNGYDRDGLARAAKAVVVHRTSVLDRLAGITAPTLVVVGKEDGATELRHSEDMVQRIAGSRLAVVDGAGHSAPIERPAVVTELLTAFVREQLG